MAAVLAPPAVTPPDRLALTICIAVICHALFILGVGFVPPDLPKPRFDTMEVTLVQTHSESPPEEAQYLAQASLQGGGDSEEADRPSSPISEQLPQIDDQVTPPAFAPEQPSPDPDIAQTATPNAPADGSEAVQTDASVEQPEQLVAENSETETPVAEPEPTERAKPDAPAEGREKRTTRPRARPSAAQLIANSFAIASLNAEIQQRLAAKAKRPRRKFISASTREYKYAAYMEAWRAKVERVGNLNYPEAARKRNLSGSLILEVQINPDGSVKEMVVRRSSGQKLLDDSALRIVELAAPFAPFPDAIAKDVDVLHVTRTWVYSLGARFKGK
jgi:protein TonB